MAWARQCNAHTVLLMGWGECRAHSRVHGSRKWPISGASVLVLGGSNFGGRSSFGKSGRARLAGGAGPAPEAETQRRSGVASERAALPATTFHSRSIHAGPVRANGRAARRPTAKAKGTSLGALGRMSWASSVVCRPARTIWGAWVGVSAQR